MRWSLAAMAALVVTTSAPAGKPVLEGYTDYEGLARRVQALDAHQIASVRSIGKTAGDRDVFLITLGAEDVLRKPAILVVGNVEAPRLVGSEIALGVAEELVAKGGDEKVRALLDRVTIYVIPRPNPDGSDRFFASPYHAVDGNARRTDDDRDFQVGEDPAEDLDGDGFITSMRVADPMGPYRVHPTDARILIKADPAKNEPGAYRLYVEGVDNDKDEKWNEDGALGVSFNRNFPAKYDYFGLGAGPNQVSETESRAVADFCFDHPNIAAVFVFGSEDNLFHPAKPGGEEKIKTKVQPNDAPLLERLAEEYRKIHGGKDAPSSPAGAGSFSDWAYLQFGRWTLVARTWWPTAEPAKANEEKKDDKKPQESKEERGADELRFLQWMDAKGIAGFTPWKTFNHPDFPGKTVEIGGIRPFIDVNPPAAEIPDLVTKHTEFLRLLSERLATIKVTDVEKDSAGSSVARLTLKLSNTAFLPTMSQIGTITEIPYPLTWELKLPESARLLSGTRRGTSAPVGGYSTSGELSWLIAVPDANARTVQLIVRSPSVGEATESIELPRTP